MQVAERAHRVIQHDPTRRVQQQARERQALLLVERQLSVPTFRTIQRGHEVAEVNPLERRDHRGLLEAAGLGGIADGGARRAERQIGPLRHERHLLA